jgi:hypothetical protein
MSEQEKPNEQDKLIAKIKKLLALATNNSNEQEAASALLKAQQLMAENDISIDTSKPEQIAYSTERCKHKWNMGFRKPLASVIARNFRCRTFFLGGRDVAFMGHAVDARIAREVFEYAYDFALSEGNKHYNRAYSMGQPTRGVFNSYVQGFIVGMKKKFDEQSVALMIIIPPDVNDKYEEMSKDWKTDKGGIRNPDGINRAVWSAGFQDGRTIINGRRIEK